MEQYITEALSEVIINNDFDDHKITASKIEAGNNFMGKLLQVKISGKNKKSEPITLHLIIKVAPSSEIVRKTISVTQFYAREIYSYQTMLPALRDIQNLYNLSAREQFNFTKCFSVYESEPKEFIILEDLTAKGYKLHSRLKSLDLDHIKLVLKDIAHYHSLSFALKKHKPEIYEEIAKSISVDTYSGEHGHFIIGVLEISIEYVHNTLYKTKMEEFLKNVHPIIHDCKFPKICEPYNVFCHGDFWQNNILFKYENDKPTELRLVDWQMVKHCSPVLDITQLIFSATDGDLRREHYEELLTLYYDTLAATLNKMDCDINECYPMDIFRTQLREIAPHGFIYSVVALILLMREAEDVLEVESIVENNIANQKYDLQFTNQTSARNFTKRFDALLRDIIELGII